MNGRLPRMVNAIVQSELALRLVQSEAVTRALVKTLAASAEARDLIDNRVRAAVRRLDLVTRADVEALRAQVEATRADLDAARGRLEALLGRLEE